MTTRSWFVVVLALGVGGCAPTSHRDTNAEPPVRSVPIARVAESAIPSSFEAGGVVRPRTAAAIASRIVALIVDVPVHAGDRVRKGQTLVVLDARELTSRVEGAEAAARSADEALRASEAGIEAAGAAQKLAAATHTRISGLQARRSATAQELDQTTAALSSADAALATARAQSAAAAASLDAARASLQTVRVLTTYATITAPFDGVIASRLADPGTMATPGTPLLLLEDTSALQLQATVDETRALLASVGADAAVQIDGQATGWTPARVVEVARTGAGAHTFTIKAALPAGWAARTGAFGRLRLSGAPRRGLVVPATGIVRRGQLTFVFAVDGENRARLRVVTVGDASDPARTEVLAGVAAGDAVVAAPPPDLVDGTRVTGADGGRPPGATP